MSISDPIFSAVNHHTPDCCSISWRGIGRRCTRPAATWPLSSSASRGASPNADYLMAVLRFARRRSLPLKGVTAVVFVQIGVGGVAALDHGRVLLRRED
jgi:hypothetical protein